MSKAARDLLKLTLEAVSICAPTQTRIFNKLAKVRAYSDDPALRRLVDAVTESYRGASHVPTMPLREMQRCRESVAALEAYCRGRLDETGCVTDQQDSNEQAR